jgi:hypothetical protein
MKDLETRIANLEETIKPVQEMPAIIYGFIEDDGSETTWCIIHPFRKTVWLTDDDEGERPKFSIYD